MERTKTSLSVSELQEQVELAMRLKKEHDELKILASKKFIEFRRESERAAMMLESFNLPLFTTKEGTFSYRYTETFKMPKTPEQRAALFTYLKDKGIYEDMITVNSRTLNAYAKEEAEVALDNGVLDFQIPGLEKSDPQITPVIRKRPQ